jgi:hypothetical protein
VGVAVAVGVGVAAATLIVPTIWQQAPCGPQWYWTVPALVNVCEKVNPAF